MILVAISPFLSSRYHITSRWESRESYKYDRPRILTNINCPPKPVILAKPLTTVPGKIKLVSKAPKRAIFP